MDFMIVLAQRAIFILRHRRGEDGAKIGEATHTGRTAVGDGLQAQIKLEESTFILGVVKKLHNVLFNCNMTAVFFLFLFSKTK